jgi:hypothetical protein
MDNNKQDFDFETHAPNVRTKISRTLKRIDEYISAENKDESVMELIYLRQLIELQMNVLVESIIGPKKTNQTSDGFVAEE